ncbi:uncharacterized protein LOC143037448 [Oratosquilla oratoria]|uniref:uncharacterized protein LOC143037448 n=1 Tax=Oratosquilla oratoria TaxID=337810 RepID=UPI003F776905
MMGRIKSLSKSNLCGSIMHEPRVVNCCGVDGGGCSGGERRRTTEKNGGERRGTLPDDDRRRISRLVVVASSERTRHQTRKTHTYPSTCSGCSLSRHRDNRKTVLACVCTWVEGLKSFSERIQS